VVVAHLPQGGDDQGRRWGELHEESAALTEWLGQVPARERVRVERVRVERAGSMYAMLNGRPTLGCAFATRCWLATLTDGERSNALWTLAYSANEAGYQTGRRKPPRKKRALDCNRGRIMGRPCRREDRDIPAEAGRSRRALRIWRRRLLPVYEAARRRGRSGGD
jgi:hypothetical protein